VVLISVMFSPPLTTACLPTEQQGFDHPLEYSEGNEGRENGHLRGSSREELCRFPYVDFGEFLFQALR
jgi:hypothetical protein